jgi:hypothetical protein
MYQCTGTYISPDSLLNDSLSQFMDDENGPIYSEGQDSTVTGTIVNQTQAEPATATKEEDIAQ